MSSPGRGSGHHIWWAPVSDLTQREEPQGGDLLIAGLGDDRNVVGRACVAPKDIGPAMVKADCFRMRLDETASSPLFVAMQLSAGARFDAGNLSSGSTRARISLSVMATRKVALPKIEEQNAILLAIECRIAPLTSLIKEAESAVNLLIERRSSLISAAVTGKIDVRRLNEDSSTTEAVAA